MGVSSSKWGPCLITGGDNISNTRMKHSIHGRLVLLHALFGGFFGFLARQRPETGDLSEPISHTSQAIQKSSQIMFTCLLSGFHGNWKNLPKMKHQFGCPQIHIISKKGWVNCWVPWVVPCVPAGVLKIFGMGDPLFLPLEFQPRNTVAPRVIFSETPPGWPSWPEPLGFIPRVELSLEAPLASYDQGFGRRLPPGWRHSVCIFGGLAVTRIHQLYLTPHSCWTYIYIYWLIDWLIDGLIEVIWFMMQ